MRRLDEKILSEILMTLEQIYEIRERTAANKIISNYFKQLDESKADYRIETYTTTKREEIEYYKDLFTKEKMIVSSIFDTYRVPRRDNSDKYAQISERVKLCNRYWFFDFFQLSGYKDHISNNSCHNRFCPNCQKLIQASRLFRFTPEIEKIAYYENADLYHLTLTAPNVSANDLPYEIDKIFKSFSYLIRYLNGKKKIKGLDFSKYGYLGAIRALEITYSVTRKKAEEYHPHLHCILALKSGQSFPKTIVNDYSYSYGKLKDKFSAFEILIQRIWRLLMTGERVTLDNINALNLGYSCKMDFKDKDSYYELFKYAFKVHGDDSVFLTYEQFLTMYYSLYARRTIQGYGSFYRLQVDDSIELAASAEYDSIRAELLKIEEPIPVCNSLDEMITDVKDYGIKIISRKNIMKILIALRQQKQRE